MSEILPSLGYQLGIGAIGGFIVGFAVKKISKLIVIIIGIFIIALLYLGIININYSALFDLLAKSLGLVESAFSWLVGIISLIPFIGSFIVGFVLGFKVG